MNNHLVLIAGKSASGKSTSLRNIKNPEGVYYANCENGKVLPFKSKFKEFTIVEPEQIYEIFLEAEKHPEIHTIIIDSLTRMMEIYEFTRVLNAANGLKAWGDYANFFKILMGQYVATSTKNVIFTGHTVDILNESEMTLETICKVKGSLNNIGIESYFSTVVATKKITLKKLEGYKSPLLNISDEEELLGFKHVLQVKLTKETVNDRIRASLGMWGTNETYIDGDAQLVIDRLLDYYGK